MAQDSEGGGFLAYYEKAHRDPLNRWMHHTAHTLGVLGVLVLFYNPLVGVIFALSAFPISWAGHYLFEKNTPAFFEPASRGTVGASAAKKIQVALGGVVWSAVCLWQACQRALHTRDAALTRERSGMSEGTALLVIDMQVGLVAGAYREEIELVALVLHT